MSVLIKGMDEIPEDRAVLVVMHDNGKAYIKHACTYGYSMELVKLPDTHGRLIDADALDYKLGSSDRDIYVKYTLEEEPTVIEAEDER